jgi:hypothetical protein
MPSPWISTTVATPQRSTSSRRAADQHEPGQARRPRALARVGGRSSSSGSARRKGFHMVRVVRGPGSPAAPRHLARPAPGSPKNTPIPARPRAPAARQAARGRPPDATEGEDTGPRGGGPGRERGQTGGDLAARRAARLGSGRGEDRGEEGVIDVLMTRLRRTVTGAAEPGRGRQVLEVDRQQHRHAGGPTAATKRGEAAVLGEDLGGRAAGLTQEHREFASDAAPARLSAGTGPAGGVMRRPADQVGDRRACRLGGSLDQDGARGRGRWRCSSMASDAVGEPSSIEGDGGVARGADARRRR